VIRRQLAPGRARWQKPAAVLRRLRVGRGQVIAEIGSGPGFWTLRLARAAGPRGRVFAVDPEPVMLDALRRRLERAGVRNVTQVLGRADDPGLPPGSCDLILAVNTYHHFADGPAFLRRLATLLRPRGRLVNIDFARRETPVGPPVDHRVAREDFLAAARRAGLRLVAEHRFLPHQYFLVLRPRR
jgi:ubiquinone/menaquinone biosynthesis C-methylase UbiE